MTDRVQPGGRIDPDIKEQFKEYVRENTGGNKGDYSRLLERALVEYMDNDRGARIESKIDDVLDKLDEFEPTPPTPSEEKSERERESATPSNDPLAGFNERTKSSITAIANDLPDDAKIKEYALETAIEKNAGTSPKTIKKYKNLLKKTGLAMPNPLPDEDLIYTGATRLALACENNDKITPAHIDSIVGQYADALGDNWYLDALPDDYVTTSELKYDRVPGFDSSEYRNRHGITIDSKTFQ